MGGARQVQIVPSFVIAAFDTVFVYHNDAESYYAARAFRCPGLSVPPLERCMP